VPAYKAAAYVDPAAMRRMMGGFATGVAVVTTACDGEPRGMTVNSLTSVSLSPPLLLVCLARGAHTTEAITRRGAFVVNLLSERQEELSRLFASPGTNRFAGLGTEATESGLPVLPRTLGWAECALTEALPAGDHLIALGRVLSCTYRDGLPLVFYRGRYHRVSGEGHDAGWYW
jgi:flavin reductase (DIM6/NTAB) family NADH-FMN oxidoreductase RutF